jgi:hypothetical protein
MFSRLAIALAPRHVAGAALVPAFSLSLADDKPQRRNVETGFMTASLRKPLAQPNDRQSVPLTALRCRNAAPIKLSGGKV